jgi:hypothetical protein
MKSEPGPPMTLGNAAAARVRLIVWCKDCSHQVESDPGEMAQRYSAAMTVLDWRERLICSQCGSRQIETLLLDAGVPVHVVAARCGHDPAILLRTYARRTRKADTTAADVIGAMSKGMLV